MSSVVPTGRKINGSETFIASFRCRAPAPARDRYRSTIVAETRGPLFRIMLYLLPLLGRFGE
jgi:hypothetical protein